MSRFEYALIAAILVIICFLGYHFNRPEQVEAFLRNRGYINVHVDGYSFNYMCLTRGTYINREFTATYDDRSVSGFVCVNLFSEQIETY